jgi:UTP--glucose-1-phosphate uridylyltransferase
MTKTSISKAVIPAAGLGTRFLPATKSQPKEMLPVVDKPAIQYVVEEAASSGLRDILIITGRGKRTLEDHFDRSYELEHYLEKSGRFVEMEKMRAIADMANLYYVRQKEPKGLGDAILCAKTHVSNESFAVLLADDLITPETGLLNKMLSLHDQYEASIVALQEVERDEVSKYGCIEVKKKLGDNVFEIASVVEKPTPDEAPSNLVIIGRYIFRPEIIDCLENTPSGLNSEIQLTDAIDLLLKKQKCYGVLIKSGRYDIGNKLDYLRATIEFALAREDLNGKFIQILSDIIKRYNI